MSENSGMILFGFANSVDTGFVLFSVNAASAKSALAAGRPITFLDLTHTAWTFLRGPLDGLTRRWAN